MASEQTYWNGEPCEARLVEVIVGKPPRPTWWCADLEGQTRKAVEVDYHGQKFYLDNDDGSGWHKITVGRGLPNFFHASIPITRVLPAALADGGRDEQR